MTITPDWLEIFQQPPAPHETDVGTVDPFTASELAAIDRYQQAAGVIPDCLDGVFLSGALAFTMTAAEQGWYDALGYAKAHLGWLREWHDALDSLHAELAASPHSSTSNAADRLLRHQARALIEARDKVWAAVLGWLLGDAGPQLTDGALTLSNGYLDLRSW